MIEEKEIIALAKLAKLKLGDEEIRSLTKDMGEIVAFADKINENLSVEAESPEDRAIAFSELREDEVTESLPPEEILSTAGGGERGFFAVRRSRR